ncbi:ShlB/FhaC/HecB family hemolysin secretion/activation protein, partial [Neisseria meningitidis]
MKFFPAPCLLVILAVIPLKTLAADENDAELIRSMQR